MTNISNIGSIYTYNATHTVSKDKTIISKSGVITINGQNIRINSGDSLRDLARKINSVKNKTHIEAEIIDHGRKLILKTSNSKINIIDQDGILLSMCKNKMLEIRYNCAI